MMESTTSLDSRQKCHMEELTGHPFLVLLETVYTYDPNK